MTKQDAQPSGQKLAFQQEINNIETTIAALEANRTLLGDLVADTALDLLRERLATLIQPETAPDERKRVTVLFADVSGYTALSENLDPEDVAGIMNRLFEAVTVEIHRFGGTIDKYAGDAVMALFGAPQALENHEEMAVRAALAMQRVITEFSQELEADRGFRVQMRIGLNTGEVLAGLVGGLRARSYTVMGDTVNLAARLETAAPVGGILASEQTARKLHAIFEFAAPDTIKVKGKSDPIRVYLVKGEKEKRGRVRGLAGLRSPMVGREQEFAALQQAFSHMMQTGGWQATAVAGDAGLGKSRLQQELVSWVMQTHPDVRILMSRCFNHTRTTPYHFIAELLRSLFHLSREATAETAVQQITDGLNRLTPGIDPTERQYQLGSLASILGMSIADNPLQNLEPEQRRDRTFLSLERIFAAAAAKKPLLVLVDDLHWADALSLEFMDRLLQIMAGQGLESGSAFWLILSRPPENPESVLATLLQQLAAPPNRVLHLNTLDSEQAETLIQNLLGQSLSPDLAELITDHAQGNPFYVEEVLRSLIEDGTLTKNGAWKVTQNVADVLIPPSVQDILAARIDRLPPADKQVTQHAAIIGRIFWQRILNQITEASTVEPTLLLLELRQLADRMEESKLAEDWEWVFHHGLIQEVAYNSVPKAVRRVVHQQVAQILEDQLGEQTGFLLPLIADHYEAGHMPEKAIEYLQRAGQQAAAQFANQEAITFFSRALNLLTQSEGDLEKRYQLLNGRVDIFHIIGEREKQAADLHTLQKLAQQLDSPKHQSETALRYASYHDAMSDYPEAAASAKQAVSWAEKANNPENIIRGLTAWAFALVRQGNFDVASQYIRDANALAQTHTDRHGEAISLLYEGMIHYFRGEYHQARDDYEKSLSLCRQLKDLQRQVACLNNLVAIYHGLGDIVQAKEYCEQALETARMIGNRANEATILNNLGTLLHALGNLPAAQDHYRNAQSLSRTINDRLGESMAATNLAIVLHDLERFDAAHAQAQKALAIDREIGDKRGQGYSLSALGMALAGLGELSQAEVAHQEAMQLRRSIGQAAPAIDNLAALAELAQKQGQGDRAQTLADEALTWLRQHGAEGVEYPIRVYLTCADVLRANGSPQEADAILQQAYDLLLEKAGKISAAQMKEMFFNNIPLHRQLLQKAAPLIQSETP